jgi:hypothetical protein
MLCEYGVKEVDWVSVISYTRPAIRDAVRCSRQAQIKLECVSALVLQIGLAREQQNLIDQNAYAIVHSDFGTVRGEGSVRRGDVRAAEDPGGDPP